MHDYDMNASTIRECNFALRKRILSKNFALVIEQNPLPKLSTWQNKTENYLGTIYNSCVLSLSCAAYAQP